MAHALRVQDAVHHVGKAWWLEAGGHIASDVRMQRTMDACTQLPPFCSI